MREADFVKLNPIPEAFNSYIIKHLNIDFENEQYFRSNSDQYWMYSIWNVWVKSFTFQASIELGWLEGFFQVLSKKKKIYGILYTQ